MSLREQIMSVLLRAGPMENCEATADALLRVVTGCPHCLRTAGDPRPACDWIECAAHSTEPNNPAAHAIEYALKADDGLHFLRYWFEGHFNACRCNWPQAPDEVYIGADPLFKPKG